MGRSSEPARRFWAPGSPRRRDDADADDGCPGSHTEREEPVHLIPTSSRAGIAVAALLFAVAGSLVLGAALSAAPTVTPVAEAARSGDLQAVRSLLAQGEDANAAHGDGMSALHWAAERGDAKMAEALIHAGATVDAVTRIGHYTPLHVASTAGRAAVVELLLASGANATAATSTGGVTALHLAAASGSVAAIAALLDHGAEVDAREKAWGQTPLMFAAARDRVDAIRTLLARGADPDVASKTVDLVADRRLADEAQRRQRSVMEAFEAGDVRATPTQIQAAVLSGRERYLSGEIPEAEEDPDARPPAIETQGGLTALLHAVRQGYSDAAAALLDGGADIDRVSGGRRHEPAADGDNQRAVRSRADAHRSRGRSQRRVRAQRRHAAVGDGQRRVAAAHAVPPAAAARLPAGDVPGRHAGAARGGGRPRRAADAAPVVHGLQRLRQPELRPRRHRGGDRLLARRLRDRSAGHAAARRARRGSEHPDQGASTAAGAGAAPRRRTTTSRIRSRRCRPHPVCGWRPT